MPILNTVTLGGKPIFDDPGFVGCNYFCSHAGASRYGVGFFVMMRSDFDALIAEIGSSSQSQTFPLIMQSEQGPGLNIQVVVAGAEPQSVVAARVDSFGNHPSDLMRVKVVDQRALMFTPIAKSYNTMSQDGGGFSWDAVHNSANCYPSTLISGFETWTWIEIIDDISPNFGDLNFPANTGPTWIPYNLTWDQIPLARLVDAIMSRLYYVVGWDIVNNKWTCNIPGVLSPGNNTIFNNAKPANIAGGVGKRNLSRAPSKLLVGFRSFNADNITDPYDTTGGYVRTKTYVENVNPQGVGPEQPLACGSAIAIWSGGAFVNDTQLQAIADDLAPRAFRAMTVPPGQYEFAGIWPFSPDGQIRGIMWVSDSEGARTVIRINNDRDFIPIDDLRRVMETWSNQLITGIGLSNVTMDAGDAERQVWGGAGNQSVLQIKSTRAYFNPTTPFYAGAARYNASIGVGGVSVLDPDSNFNPPDANMTFPATPNAIAVDVYEGGSAAAGTGVITAGSIVLGTKVGTDNETPPLPVFYFSSAPSGALFLVLLSPNATPGSQGTASTSATWAYDGFLFDGTGLQLFSNQQPAAARPFGQITQATMGWAYITTSGTIQLAEAIEPPITATCTALTASSYSALPAYLGF